MEKLSMHVDIRDENGNKYKNKTTGKEIESISKEVLHFGAERAERLVKTTYDNYKAISKKGSNIEIFIYDTGGYVDVIRTVYSYDGEKFKIY